MRKLQNIGSTTYAIEVDNSSKKVQLGKFEHGTTIYCRNGSTKPVFVKPSSLANEIAVFPSGNTPPQRGQILLPDETQEFELNADEVYIYAVQEDAGVGKLYLTAQTSQSQQNNSSIVLDGTAKKLIAIGDSITYQNHGPVATRFEANGPLIVMNTLMGRRFTFTTVENKGVSGDDTTEMVARLSDLSGLGGDICSVLCGTNDVNKTSLGGTGAALKAYTNSLISTAIANLSTTYDYIINTLGIPVLAFVVSPRSTWASTIPEQIAEGKRAIKEINEWIKSQASENIIVVDYYDDWNNGSDEPKANYTYDGLHPLYLGAYWMGYRARQKLLARYGDYNFALSANNVAPNPTMSGTGGTVSGSIFTGVLADNCTT